MSAPDNAAQKRSPSLLLAEHDPALLQRDELRDIRLALEYAKVELALRDWGIRSTVIVFGSSRTPSPEQLAALREEPAMPAELAARHVARYAAARSFGRIVSERGGAFAPHDRWRDNVIATGGGPGVMEAANRGAFEAGAPNIGFNITLPKEQEPNPYTTPELTFRLHYFGMRKMHFALRAAALVVFPGGFGTMDELFEILTLTQTGKTHPIPIVLFDERYWRRVVNFEALLEEGVIGPADLALFDFADTVEAAWEALLRRGLRVPAAAGS